MYGTKFDVLHEYPYLHILPYMNLRVEDRIYMLVKCGLLQGQTIPRHSVILPGQFQQ